MLTLEFVQSIVDSLSIVTGNHWEVLVFSGEGTSLISDKNDYVNVKTIRFGPESGKIIFTRNWFDQTPSMIPLHRYVTNQKEDPLVVAQKVKHKVLELTAQYWNGKEVS